MTFEFYALQDFICFLYSFFEKPPSLISLYLDSNFFNTDKFLNADSIIIDALDK